LGNTFDGTLRREIFLRMSPNGSLTGEGFKAADEALGKQARAILGNHNSNAWDRQLGDAYREAQGSLRGWVQRTAPPGVADDIGNANRAWAEMLRVQNASGRAGAEPGMFTPAQLQQGAKKYSSEAQFTSGRALMGDLADAGRTVLGQTVPDSGTPYRALLNLGTLATTGGAAPFSLWPLIGYTGSTALTAALYSPMGRRALAAALAARPAGAPAVAGALRGAGAGTPALAPAIGALGF
jgi:hypothetical protein